MAFMIGRDSKTASRTGRASRASRERERARGQRESEDETGSKHGMKLEKTRKNEKKRELTD